MANDQESHTNIVSHISLEIDEDISVIAIIKRDTSSGTSKKKIKSISMNPTSTEDKAEVILTDKPVKLQSKGADLENTQVIELGDKTSKMKLRKQFKVETNSPETSAMIQHLPGNSITENLDILQKLPPGTIIIKQESNTSFKEDGEYVRESSKDSTETNSSCGSSTSGAAEKSKRMHRARRTKKTVEVRRNPMRGSKKNVDKDFPRPRQRLLTAKRKENLIESESSKRITGPTMPYMNTRSVTRKLYTVGATYQAPSIKDETEWKEWPVHGMHERPAFHPQAGLAAEYIGRYFTTLDGHTYREIVDQPEIEVVSVDPHPEKMSLMNSRKRNAKGKLKCRDPLSIDPEEVPATHKESFDVCMHNSLHSVLAYCAQKTFPAYQENMEQKNAVLNKSDPLGVTDMKNDVNFVPTRESEETSRPGISTAEVKEKEYDAQGKDFENFILGTDIYKKKIDTVIGTECFFKKDISKDLPNEFNLTTLEDSTISDETLMEMSSIYTRLIPTERTNSTVDNSLSRKAVLAKRILKPNFLNNPNQSAIAIDLSLNSQRRQENHKVPTTSQFINDGFSLQYQNRSNKKIRNYVPPNSSPNVSFNSNKTSEIARILSDYNQSLKKPGVQSDYQSSTKMLNAEVLRTKLKQLKTHYYKNVTASENELTESKFQQRMSKNRFVENNNNQSQTTNELKFDDETFNAKVDVKPQESNSDIFGNIDKSKTINMTSPKTEGDMKNKEIDIKDKYDIERKTEWLEELLEDTAMLYCAATGVHQNDLAEYIDTLDGQQSIKWLETHKESIL